MHIVKFILNRKFEWPPLQSYKNIVNRPLSMIVPAEGID